MVVLSRLVLILTLIAGSTLMAPMRGQMAGLSQVEVCSDGQPQMLTLDLRGKPVPWVHACPDCLICTATGPLPETGRAQLVLIAIPVAFFGQRAGMAAGQTPTDPAARDPPVLA